MLSGACRSTLVASSSQSTGKSSCDRALVRMPQGQHARHGLECLGAGAGVQRGLPVGARQYLAAWNRSASAKAGSSKARRRWCVSNASRSSASAAPDDSKQSISASIAGPNRCARAFFLELGASLLTRARPRASSSYSLISNSSATRRRRRRPGHGVWSTARAVTLQVVRFLSAQLTRSRK